MKLAITGKGGVGKTTLTSLLAQVYADKDYRVLAIDADPSPCLGLALGFPSADLQQIVPIADMEALIHERTGAQPGSTGGYFKLNPRVDDIPDQFSLEERGVRLLQLGAVRMGGAGCICPESALLRALVTHILLRRDEIVLLDMYAGVEHLGRATADAVDAMLIVVEPTARSVATARQIQALAGDIGIERLALVGNKVRSEADVEYIAETAPEFRLLGSLPYEADVVAAERHGVSAYAAAPALAAAARDIAARCDTGWAI